MEGPDTLYWLLLIAVAIVSDLFAGHFLSRKIPNIDTLVETFVAKIAAKLDRPERSKAALRTRGFVVLLLCLPTLYFLGGFSDALSRMSAVGTAIALLALIPVIGQRKIWAEHTEAGRKLAENTAVTDPQLAAQNATQKVILRYSARYFPVVILYALGGFSFLLPYLFLSNFIQVGVRTDAGLGPFYKYSHWLHELISLPISILAALFLGLAHFFIPSTNLRVFMGLAPNKTRIIASHFIPLNIMANGSKLNFLQKNNAPNQLPKQGKWIGPDNGRAKLTPQDMRTVWLVVLVAFGLSLIAFFLFFMFLSVTTANDL